MSTHGGPRLDPRYARVLLPAVMATAMSLVMSLVDTIVRVGFAANLAEGGQLATQACSIPVQPRERPTWGEGRQPCRCR